MKEENLIFLISQPRSGSSLLQQLLINTETITSSPESWQMLSLVHTYKPTSMTSSYNPNYTSLNFNAHLKAKDNGLAQFKQQIKQLALRLYGQQIGNHKFFLDKTPRYYHIIDELYELFPNAKFIFLVRNPLAVFASILSYNFSGNYIKFLSSKDRIDDLFLAPKALNNAVNTYENCILVAYENLVTNTKKELEWIYKYLGIEMPENYKTYELNSSFKASNAVDTKSLSKHSEPSKNYLSSWKTSIDSQQKKVLANRYLELFSANHPNYFAYQIKEIKAELSLHNPPKKERFNLTLDMLINEDSNLPLFKLVKKRFMIKYQ